MTIFDPRDWCNSGSWFAKFSRQAGRRRASEINREVLQRWLTAVAFCLCFASLGPAQLIMATFTGLLFMAALVSMGRALVRDEQLLSPYLTAWDEAVFSIVLGVGLSWSFGLPLEGLWRAT